MVLDLLGFAVSSSYLAYSYFSSLIRRRLQEAGGSVKSEWIFNQPSNLRQYWALAHDRHWSRVPVFGACVAFLCGLASSAGVVVILIAQKR
jgi:hypothetical protein